MLFTDSHSQSMGGLSLGLRVNQCVTKYLQYSSVYFRNNYIYFSEVLFSFEGCKVHSKHVSVFHFLLPVICFVNYIGHSFFFISMKLHLVLLETS
jgi:hypothetical protein